MQRISRDGLRALLDAGSVTLVEALPTAAQLPSDPARTAVNHCAGPSRGRSKVAAAFGRLGYRDVRVCQGPPLEGTEVSR
jgi:hypothetical protein